MRVVRDAERELLKPAMEISFRGSRVALVFVAKVLACDTDEMAWVE